MSEMTSYFARTSAPLWKWEPFPTRRAMTTMNVTRRHVASRAREANSNEEGQQRRKLSRPAAGAPTLPPTLCRGPSGPHQAEQSSTTRDRRNPLDSSQNTTTDTKRRATLGKTTHRVGGKV